MHSAQATQAHQNTSQLNSQPDKSHKVSLDTNALRTVDALGIEDKNKLLGDAPRTLNAIADHRVNVGTLFSFSAPADTFTNSDTPNPVLLIGDPSVYNPTDRERMFSSTYANQAPGVGYGRSMLDSPQAWSAGERSANEWIQLPLPAGLAVAGVITQGRANNSQWITKFTATSIDAQGNESALNGGAELIANSDRNTKVLNRLDIPDSAVAIRLYPSTWHTYPSMRVALAASWLLPDGDTISGTPLFGDSPVTVTATGTNADGTSASDEFVVYVNHTPVITVALANQSATEDSAFAYSVPANTFGDVDGDTLSLAVTSALPSWLSFDAASASFSGTPLNADVGSVSITVQASDASSSVADTFVLSVANTNDAPTLANPVANASATEDAAFSLLLPANTFSDVDSGDTLTLSAPTLPVWLSFDPANRSLSGTPNNNHVGENPVLLRATDAAGATAEAAFAVQVSNVNDAPTLDQGIDDQAATEDLAFSLTIPSDAFSDPDPGETLSYAILSGPPWLTLSAEVLSGTPDQTDVGTTTVTLRATDSGALSTDAVFALSVAEVNDNAPVFSSATAVSVEENRRENIYTAAASDADTADSLAFSIAGDDAALFSLDATSGALDFVSAPDFENPDDADADRRYQLQIRATDAADNSAVLALTVTVLDVNDNAPALTSAERISVVEGNTAIVYIATSTDPDRNDSVTYTLGGSDAGAFSIATNGEIRFVDAPDFETPQDADSDNTYAIQLIATDNATNTDSLDIAVTVSDRNDETPLITSADSADLAEGSNSSFYVASAYDGDAGDTLAWSLGGADGSLFRIDAVNGNLRPLIAADYEATYDVDGNHHYELRLIAADAAGHTSEQALTVILKDVNEAPIVEDQRFSIGEFEAVGKLVGSLEGSDPDSDALVWTLISDDSPFSMDVDGQIRLNAPIDFETTANYALTVQLSDGDLHTTARVSVAVADENEILRLVNALPVDLEGLSREGISEAVAGRERYYNAVIAAADPQPTTLAQLQALIDKANATAEIVEGAKSGSSSAGANGTGGALPLIIEQLRVAGITGTQVEKAAAYERAIATASPAPSTPEELQALVEEVNRVDAIVTAAIALQSGGGEQERFAKLIGGIEGMPEVPQTLQLELATAIATAVPVPRSEAELIALAEQMLARVARHPVIYLSLYQGGQQVQQIHPLGGPVSIEAHLSNPVLGLSPSFDWTQSDQSLLMAATQAPNAGAVMRLSALSISAAKPVMTARVTVEQDGMRADGEIQLLVADAAIPAEHLFDTDGDGVVNLFEGVLEASVDPEAAKRLQSAQGDDLNHVLESEQAVILRLGDTARAAQANQAVIRLEDIVRHKSGATSVTVIEQLPHAGEPDTAQVFDFELANLPHAGASVHVVLPLAAPLYAGASYVKYHPATGWVAFEQNALNQLYSAHYLAGIAGQCPPAGHSVWQKGLIEGHSCIQLLIQDGGPNDADRLGLDGSAAGDAGLNGSIEDPGALVYTRFAGLGGATATMETGIDGGGSVGILTLLYLAALGSLARLRSHRGHAALLGVVSGVALSAATVHAKSDHALNFFSLGAVSSDLQPKGDSEGFRADGKRSTGWRLGVGRQFGDHLQLELNLTHAGAVGLLHRDRQVQSHIPEAEISYLAPGLTLGWSLKPPGSALNAFARLGLARLKTKANNTDGLVAIKQLHEMQTTLGAGFDWRLQKRLKLRLAYDIYDTDARWLSVNLLTSFGGLEPLRAGVKALTQQSPATTHAQLATSTRHAALTLQTHSATAPPPAPICNHDYHWRRTIYFHMGDHRVLADDEAELFFISQQVSEQARLHILLDSYSDQRETTAPNNTLAQRRATAVANTLGALFTGEYQPYLQIHNHGAVQAPTGDSDPASLAYNRRVELRFKCRD